MAEHQLPKLNTRVRFPSSAPRWTGIRLAFGVIPAIPDAAKRLTTRSITIDGNTLDPTLRLMLAGQKLTGVESILTGEDPVTNRRRLRRQTKAIDRNPVQVRAVADLSIPGPAGSIPARHYLPDNDEAGPLLMFIHGGGWVIGDLDTQDNLCRAICRGAGIHVLSVDYRLAPEHPAPAGVEDCYAAYRWALEHGTEPGTRPGVVAVGGDSAGGNLAAVISRLGRDDGAAPALQLLLYPSADTRGETRSRALFANGFFLTEAAMNWFRDHYLGSSQLDATDPLVSPVLAENLSGLPRALVITAGFDPLRDEGETYAEAMHDDAPDGRVLLPALRCSNRADPRQQSGGGAAWRWLRGADRADQGPLARSTGQAAGHTLALLR
jgi:acetyl esterase